MNIKTIGHLYDASLTATQMMTLHLWRNRGKQDCLFGEYMASLPDDFNGHPLVKDTIGLPESVKAAVHDVRKRFESDVAFLCSYDVSTYAMICID